MGEAMDSGRGRADGGLARGIVTIVLVGIGLGLAFNVLGEALPWISKDRVAALESLDDLPPAPAAAAPAPAPTGGGYNEMSDPMGIDVASDTGALPEIPDLDRPVQIGLDAVKALVDAQAAMIVDARDPEEFAEGHIPGALSLPYDEVTAEPERLEQLDAGGRPIVVYCGGGACELSLNLAWDLITAGQRRVVVFMGGFPEWVEAGYPVRTGPDLGT